MKIFSESHKTVFVVDHCPYMAESCRQHVEFDMLVKNRTQGIIPLAPISKSLWTCSVESSMEYCRIMYDIFPFKKLVNFIVSDSGAHVLNSWTQEDQNLQELMAALAAVGPPNPRADPECCSILHGLVAAVETLCKITEYQHEARTLLMENAERVGNRGRIICITNAKSDSHVRMLEDCVQETIHEHNKLAANSDHLMQIQKCELVLIHTYPVGEDSLVSDRSKKELSPVLTSEVHSVRAGRHLATKLNILVQQHFDLASTTITNIPMKEEQHANTSANYDVELLHHKDAHVDFLKSGDSHLGGGSREGSFKETITLKWCTPRTNNIELHYCTGAYRISPVDVNSRPSSCLTNFLLNGRSVLLEQPRKSGSKVISHMLSSHGGEIFLHVLSSSRSILEDPPSISEGCGGRVTDYRITVVPLASVIVKESLTEEDVLNCQKTIYNLVDMERKNDPLPISTVGTRGKGPKRDEQYRIMWNELETLVRAHINNSEKHQRVLECLMACRSKPPEEEERKKRGRKREDKEDKSEKAVKDYEQEKSWQDSERLKGILERGKEELAEAEIIKDSPDSPEPPNKKPLVEMDETPQVEKSKGPVSLLSLWSNRINTANSRKHQEFAGRLNSVNNRAELYQHLKEENGMETTENGKASRQ
ncbi:integrator complex subunit 13 isoform X4 [Pan paniscus]|nr:integrator complex subunit 13 isoform X6 [Homo sapiens]XP_016875124.1 integrator complex subunit 13 isoform X6 [Homo sapiens]XP_054228518.1 integrator complex subunit 13 isoform X6 [Homo sapiens]XP_054228519.1 integrator complex subunit 13 isoform X6 [Homo sapiens]XP_054951795.1 integrator complex subunit 13 isoform X4 [Pan paniscus]EAW96538.1 chromosome 12 open reading frame 11, isoform CRA_a [Homo sapiens]|eukprot:XP_005253479.1 integrator complex subunit 13 isoform X6 [Homo sapiens]